MSRLVAGVAMVLVLTSCGEQVVGPAAPGAPFVGLDQVVGGDGSEMVGPAVWTEGPEGAWWCWEAPAEGSEAVLYVVLLQRGGGAWRVVAVVDGQRWFQVRPQGGVWRLMVAGVDSLGRVGPMSPESAPWEPCGGDRPEVHRDVAWGSRLGRSLSDESA